MADNTDIFKANYVAAELRNPSKQLPLSINTAIPTIILCYVAANAVYYVLLPWKVISTTDAVAVVSTSACCHSDPTRAWRVLTILRLQSPTS
jgi:amino acid transporter